MGIILRILEANFQTTPSHVCYYTTRSTDSTAEVAEAAEASESTVTVTLSSSPPSSDSEADAEITSSSETGRHTQSPEPSLLSRLRAPQLAEI